MRKDIDIPEVKDVYIAAVFELNEDYNTHDWNIYIINDGKTIISEGLDANYQDIINYALFALIKIDEKNN